MNKLFLLAILYLLCTFSVFAQSDDIDSLKLDWELYTLQNGMQVLLQQDLTREDIAIEFWLKTGVSDEEEGTFGLAHFFEHATPYGIRDDKERRERLHDNMNFSNAQVRMDYIRYFMQVQPEVLELGLHYVSDRLKADTTSITERSVEWHRNNVLKEIDRQAKHPIWSALTGAAFQKGTFGGHHPYGHDGYGTRENNELFNVQDIRSWYNEHVFATNVILYVIGNFERNETKKFIESYFSDIHQKEKQTKPQICEAQHSTESVSINVASDDHAFTHSWALSEWGSEDDAGLRLLANILQQRVNDDINRPTSITSLGVNTSFYRMAGEFSMYARFDNLSDSSAIKNYFIEHARQVKTNGVTDEELSDAIQTEMKSIQAMIEKKQLGFIGSRVQLLGEELLYTGNPDSYLERLQKQQELTITDIQNVANKWLTRPPFQLLVKGNSKSG